jgi:hypothetical protein
MALRPLFGRSYISQRDLVPLVGKIAQELEERGQ